MIENGLQSYSSEFLHARRVWNRGFDITWRHPIYSICDNMLLYISSDELRFLVALPPHPNTREAFLGMDGG